MVLKVQLFVQEFYFSLSDETAEHSSEYGQLLCHHRRGGSELPSRRSLHLQPSRCRGESRRTDK